MDLVTVAPIEACRRHHRPPTVIGIRHLDPQTRLVALDVQLGCGGLVGQGGVDGARRLAKRDPEFPTQRLEQRAGEVVLPEAGYEMGRDPSGLDREGSSLARRSLVNRTTCRPFDVETCCGGGIGRDPAEVDDPPWMGSGRGVPCRR